MTRAKDYVLFGGQSLQNLDIGFQAAALIVDNITNQWLYESQRRRYIPPYQSGVTIPLPGSVTDSITSQAPGQIAQATANPGEFAFLSFTDQPQLAGLGVNVGSFTAPPPVLVTDLQQQAAKPNAPGAGVSRLWADLSGELHRELADATDSQYVSEALALAGVLTGHLPNPGLAAGAALANLSARSICQINFAAISTTISTTSGAFVATGDAVSLNTQSTASLLLAFYYGTFTNSVAGAFNQFYLGIDAANSLGASAMTTKVATYYDQVLAIAYGTGLSVANHVFQAYWATNTGTLSSSGLSRNVLAVEITK